MRIMIEIKNMKMKEDKNDTCCNRESYVITIRKIPENNSNKRMKFLSKCQ